MRTSCFISITFLTVCGMALADPTNTPSGPGSTGSNWVDETHSNMEVAIDQATVWLDDSLGDTGVMTGKQASCIATIGAEVLLEDGGSARFRSRGHVKFDLPRTKRRLHLFVDNFRYDLLPGADQEDSGDEVNVGTHWGLSRTVRSMFDFDIGVRVRRPPQVFTRLEFLYKRQLGDWGFRLDQREFWTVRDHFGELTVVTFTHPLGPRYLFRSLTAGKWSQKSDGLECEQTLGVFMQFAAKRRQLDLSASAFTVQNDFVNYRLSAELRSKWLRRWNTVYIIPELQFRVSEDLRARPAVRIGIETVYW